MTSWASFNRKNRFAPNALSAFRGLLGILLPFLLLRPKPFWHLVALLIFIIGAITDYWDGLLARRQGLETDLGKIVDPTMDKILILGALATFAYLGLYSLGWIIPIFFREFVVTFCRIGWLREGKAVAAEKLGKIKFAMQVAALSFAFLYFLSFDFAAFQSFQGHLRRLTLLFLFVAVLLTLVSGLSFLFSNAKNFESQAFAKFTAAMGVGLIPVVPGTWGTLLGLAFVFLTHFHLGLYLATWWFLVWVGYWSVSRLDLSEDKDPRHVVVDEVCGIFIPFVGIPLSPLSVLLGFLLFRVFDVFKPYPIRRLEALPGYWGILCDDLGAGVYSWVILCLLFR